MENDKYMLARDMGVMLIEYDKELNVLDLVNPSDKLLLQHKADLIKGSTVERLEALTVAENREQASAIAGSIRQAFQEKRNLYIEYYSLGADEGMTYAGSHIVYIPEQDKVRQLVFEINKNDIRKTSLIQEAENRLLRQDNNRICHRNRMILESLPIGVVIYSNSGHSEYLNASACAIFGIDHEKIRDHKVDINDNPNIPLEVVEAVKNHSVICTDILYDFSLIKDLENYTNDTPDQVKHIECSGTPVMNRAGEVENYVLVVKDITDHQAQTRQLSETRQNLMWAMEIGNVSTWSQDLRTRKISVVKPEGVDDSESNKSMPYYLSRIHPDDREASVAKYEEVLSGKSEYVDILLRILNPSDNTYHFYDCRYGAKKDADGQLTYINGIQRDITDLVMMREAKNKAEELDRLKSAFISNMSHEIRTPLNAIVGFSHLLIETEDVNEKNEFIQVIQNNTELLLQLISDILDLSKIEAGKVELLVDEVEVNELCEDIIRSMQIKAAGKVRLIFESGMASCHIMSDKRRLNQILLNFMTNALKFTSAGSVTLGFHLLRGGYLRFYVRDTGIGIPENKVEYIFDRFVKLNNFSQGTGLGLPICKSLVKQMNGEIGVNSTEGEGSEFWFTTPVDLSSQEIPETVS